MDATAEELTLSEAAGRLGVSKDTVRRRGKRGELKGRQVETKFGLEWRVALDTASTPLPTSAGADAVGLTDQVRLLGHTQAELVQTTAAASMWQSRAEHWQALYEQAQRQLAPPRTDPTPAAPWWRRWFMP